jgi:hypothetical protein
MAHHFHVILEDRQYHALVREANRSSLPIGELVRRAIDAAFELDVGRKTPGVEVSFGVWRRPDSALAGRRPGIRFGG